MSEDEKISGIFAALKHPIRRRILDELSQEEGTSFSDLMHSVELEDTGTFGFHLNVLRNLVELDKGGKYRLSNLGKVAHQLSESVQNSKGVKDVVKEEQGEIKPLLQLNVEGTHDLDKLSFGYWSNISPEDKEKRKKLLDFVVNKLEEVEKANPKPILEIQVTQTPDKNLTNVNAAWLIGLSKDQKKEYIDLLVDKLMHNDVYD